MRRLHTTPRSLSNCVSECASARSGNLHFSWIAELLAFDLPANGSGSLAFIGAQALRFSLAPAIDLELGTDFSVTLDSVDLHADWSLSAGFSWQGSATNFSFHTGASTLTINALKFPPAGGFDIQHIDTTAAALGLTAGELESVFSLLLSWVASHRGREVEIAGRLPVCTLNCPSCPPMRRDFRSRPVPDYCSAIHSPPSADGSSARWPSWMAKACRMRCDCSPGRRACSRRPATGCSERIVPGSAGKAPRIAARLSRGRSLSGAGTFDSTVELLQARAALVRARRAARGMGRGRCDAGDRCRFLRPRQVKPYIYWLALIPRSPPLPEECRQTRLRRTWTR